MRAPRTNSKAKSNITTLTISITILMSMGCAKSSQFATQTPKDSNQSAGVTPGTTTTDPSHPSPQPSQPSAQPNPPSQPVQPAPPSLPSYKMEALVWESSKYPQRTQWSEYLEKIILENWNTLLPGADDITDFCPRYNSLDNNQRANVWAQLFAGVAKYESAFDPTSRMQETTMGTDPVTGRPVYSEGLLQLSYQDIQGAGWCKFDWAKDKSLSPTDPKKTILDPYLNLDCGVGIMAKQIKTKGRIVISSGVYWSTLKAGGMYSKVSSIQSIVKSLSLCK
ncbi:MAG: hypothetical protein ACXVCY_06475 [Pseudobdellovibrionaceae bacterium]